MYFSVDSKLEKIVKKRINYFVIINGEKQTLLMKNIEKILQEIDSEST